MRRSTILVSALAASVIAASCGTQSKEKKEVAAPHHGDGLAVADTDPAKADELAAELKKLPENVVLRVQLDEKGQEIPSSSSMVAVNGAVTESNLDEAFRVGRAIDQNGLSDSLDGDSSTQSWFGYGGGDWNSNNSFQQNYQNQTAINYNNYGVTNIGQANVGNGNWGYQSSPYYSWYRPLASSFTNTGSWWQYRRPFCYTNGGFNYYNYQRPNCFGRVGCGFGGGGFGGGFGGGGQGGFGGGGFGGGFGGPLTTPYF